jgi:O-antigen/teichoic acid export membrane protein
MSLLNYNHWYGSLRENHLFRSFRVREGKLTLRANFSYTLVGNVVYAGCQWGMLMVLAKLGSPEMVGQFALGLAVAGPVILFANLGLRSAQATDAKQDYQFADYLTLRLLTTTLALLAIMVIVMVTGCRPVTAAVILIVGLAKAFEAVSDVIYGLLQQHERMDRIAFSMLIKGPLSLMAMGLSVYISGSMIWGAVALALTWVGTLIGYDRRSGQAVLALSQKFRQQGLRTHEHLTIFRLQWNWPLLLQLIWLTLPLGLATLLTSLNGNMPRYFIERYAGEGDLGIFAAQSTFMVAMGMVVTALAQSASPRLAQHYAAANAPAFLRLIWKLLGLGAMLGAAGLVAGYFGGRLFLSLAFRPEYAARLDVFHWLLWAGAFNNIFSMLGYCLIAARYFRAVIGLQIVAVLASFLACLWLVPAWGILGAAMSMVISLALQILVCAFILGYACRRISDRSD